MTVQVLKGSILFKKKKKQLRIMSHIRESQLGKSSNNGEIRGNASGEWRWKEQWVVVSNII